MAGRDDDIRIGIDATPAESGEKRVVAALGRIKKSATDLGTSAEKSINKISTALGKIKNSSITLKLNTGDGMARLSKFSAALQKINRKQEVKISIQAALGQITRLQNSLAKASDRLTRINVKVKIDEQAMNQQIQRMGTLVLSLERIRPRLIMDTSAVDLQIQRIAANISRLSRVSFSPGISIGAGTAATLRSLARFQGFDPAAIQSVRAMAQAINNMNISGSTANGLRQFALAASAMGRLTANMRQASAGARNVSSSFMRLHSDSLTLSGGILRTSAALQNLVAILGLSQIANTISVYQKTMAGLTAVTGSAENAAAEFQWASDTADKFSVSLGSIAPNYMQLVAAGNAAGISIDKIHDIFDGVTQASRVFGLSVEDTEGVYRALTQIIAKGSLQMEELRGQLGDRLPVAVQAFAKGLGVTTQELFQMTKQQEVQGETLERGLVGFGRALREMTNGGLTDTLNSIPAAIGRMQTAFLKFSIFLNEAGLGAAITNILDGLTKLLTIQDAKGNLTTFGFVVGALSKAFEELTKHMSLLAFLSLGLFATGMARLVAGMMAAQKVAASAGGAMSGFIGALGKFNLFMIGLTAAVTIFDALTTRTSEAEKAADALAESQKSLGQANLDTMASVDQLKQAYSQLTAEQKKSAATAYAKAIADGKAAQDALKKALSENDSMFASDLYDKAGVQKIELNWDKFVAPLKEAGAASQESYLKLKAFNEELSRLTLPENASELEVFFNKQPGKGWAESLRPVAAAYLAVSQSLQTTMEATARAEFQQRAQNGTLSKLDPITRQVAEANGWFADSLDEVAKAQTQVVSDADRFNRWAETLDSAMSQVAGKAEMVRAALAGIAIEQELIKNKDILASSTSRAGSMISETLGKDFAESGVGKFAQNVLGVGLGAKTVAETQAAERRFNLSFDRATDFERDLNKPGKGGGGLSKDDFNDISKYAGESTRVTLEYKRAMDELNEAAAKHPELIKEAGGLQKVQMEMTAKYHRDLQQALETERSIQWDDKYLTVEKKVRDIVNGVKELTPLEEAVNEKYEIRRQLFILLGDSDKGRKATAEAILAIEEKTNRLMSERSASMADKYTGSKYGAVQEVESDIRSLNRDQSSLMTDIVGGNFSAAADYARNAATLIQMNQQLKIAQLESTKLGQAFSTSADAIGSALTDLVMNGKMDVRGLITTILNEFFKLLVIEPLIQQLKSAMGEWLGGSSDGGGFNFLNPLSWFGFGHTGGMVNALPHPRKYHTGGIVPRGGISGHGIRSWEKMTQVPKGSEIIKEHDRRHSNMMPVILKAGEEVLPPWDSRNFAYKYHTGGMVEYADPQAMVNDGKNYAAKSPSNDNRPVGGGITIHNENKITFQGVAPRSDTGDATKLATKIGEHIAEESNKSSRIASVKMMVNTRNMKMA